MAERPSSGGALPLALTALGVVVGVISIFYLPFGLAPIAFLLVLIGTGRDPGNRRNGMLAAMFVTLCFIVGASIAVWNSTSLY